MNDPTFDSDDAESRDPDEGDQRSLEDRWRRFLTGKADEERRLRMEKRRQRIQEELDPEQDPEQDPGEDPGEGPETEGSDDEETAEEPAVGDASSRFRIEPDSEQGRAGARKERTAESRLFATDDEDPGVDEDAGVGEDPSEPRTRAEELRVLGKDRRGTADSGESVDPGTPSPGPEEPSAGSDERDDGPDEDALGGAPELPPPVDRDAPVVIPAKNEMDRPAWRRYWKPITAGVALLLVATFAVRGMGGGGGGSASDEGASPGGAEAASAVDVDRAEALTDSLEAVLGRYRERRQDFDLGRLDCAGLARGYEEVQSALGELRSAVPNAEDLGAGPLRRRYRSLVSSVETVEEGYADTGCAGSA